jgi:hypothetical protein
MKYKKFNVEYSRIQLLSLFGSSEKQIGTNFTSAVGYSTESLPCTNIFGRALLVTEYGLSELIVGEEMHAKPNNNGLIIFPITGSISVEFEDSEKFVIDTPIAINGSLPQKLYPIRAPAIFFAIKIPLNITFEDAINLLP